jgi:hypothetical protein
MIEICDLELVPFRSRLIPNLLRWIRRRSGDKSLEQLLPVFFVIHVEKARTFLRQPSIGHIALQRPPFSIDRPRPTAFSSKMAEAATTSAACMCQS